MLNLFLTDFRRLIKDKVFYIGFVILAFYGFWGVRTTSCFDLDKCISIDGSSMIVTIPAMIILFVIFFTSLFKADKLVMMANQNGGKDNISVIIIEP